jgi:tRNA1(Val) A37 N6-methylase TrmN6
MQTSHNLDPKNFANTKQILRERLGSLEKELNHHLASEYGVQSNKKSAYEKWRSSYQPFHWFVEFYGIMQSGGFDVIIGNPPYVEYKKVRGTYSIKNYDTMKCSNLYAYMSDRSLNLINKHGSFGFIVPISVICTQRMKALQEMISLKMHSAWFSNYA